MPLTTDWLVRRTIVATAYVTGEEPMRANALGFGFQFRPDVVRLEWLRRPDGPYTLTVTVSGPALTVTGAGRRDGRRASWQCAVRTELDSAPPWVQDAVLHLRGSMTYQDLLHFDGATTFPAHHPAAREG